MAEIAFKQLMGALETVAGTAITAPTHLLNVSGRLADAEEWFEARDNLGTLEEVHQVHRTKVWSTLSVDSSPADPQTLPFWLNLAVGPGVITTPGGGSASRLHTHTPAVTSNTLKTATFWDGDPNTQVLRAPLGILETLGLTADVSGSDGVMMTASGRASELTPVADPTVPAAISRLALLPGNMQVWLDTSSAIGTTDITNRVVSASQSIDSGYGDFKFLPGGATGALTPTRVGRRARTMETTLQLEYLTDADRAIWKAGTTVKLRVRYYGPLIEGAIYSYVNFDSYGPLRSPEWGEYATTNQTITFTQRAQKDATAGVGFIVSVMNSRTTV